MIQARTFVVASIAMVFASVAFADNKVPGKTFTVSWNEFVERCRNPDGFDNQREPRQIKIQCTNAEREFVPEAPGTIETPAVRRVITTVLSDKFNVGSIDQSYPIAQKPGTCPRYKEIEKVITIERPITCGEVLAINDGKGNQKGNPGSVSDYCAAALNTAKGVSPKLIDIHETGVRIDSCGGQGQYPGKTK